MQISNPSPNRRPQSGINESFSPLDHHPASNPSSNRHQHQQEPLDGRDDEDAICAAERGLEAMTAKFGSEAKRLTSSSITIEESEIVQTCHAAIRRFAAYGNTAANLLVSIIMSDPQRKKKDAETERFKYVESQDPEKPFYEKLLFLSRLYDHSRSEGKIQTARQESDACGFNLSEDNPCHLKRNPQLKHDDRSKWG
ncbi:hypothetical protein SISNIDRAFT_466737 [Sistotremastrum niveocremeum HHB9708]|uniref:Uncharacterized protein n=1 Tax=Sistotremastrum niveocremeum HHB9708 TaxID=1314777 RepID=A0A164TFH0_9AGAM|nr:hypothetical protein SISNIDRAFT_466737 [Sistotremastrum niveocremeum HHB9708]